MTLKKLYGIFELVKQKGSDFMAAAKDIHLTDDPLTNIYMMIPLLGKKEREAVSYLMYGCCIGQEMAGSEKSKTENAVV